MSCEQTPICHMTYLAHAWGLTAQSVECRHALAASLTSWPISGARVFAAIERKIKTIEKYHDGRIFDDYYKASIAWHRQQAAMSSRFIAYLKGCSLSVKEAFRTHVFQREAFNTLVSFITEDLRRELESQGLTPHYALQRARTMAAQTVAASEENICMQVLCRLFSFLVDAKTLHLINQNRDKKTIFVYVGGTHAENVAKVLADSGYQLIDTYGDEDTMAVPLDISFYFQTIEPQQHGVSHKRRCRQSIYSGNAYDDSDGIDAWLESAILPLFDTCNAFSLYDPWPHFCF